MTRKAPWLFPLLLIPAGVLALLVAGVFEPGGETETPHPVLAQGETTPVSTEGAEEGPAESQFRESGDIPKGDEPLDAGEVMEREPGQAPPPLVPAVIRGQIVDHEGKPVRGIEFRLLSRVASVKRKTSWPYRYKWKTPRKRTDSRGRFHFRFTPPPPLAFTLQTHGDGFVPIRRTWKEIASGAVIDLGKIKLQRGGTIRGRVVDERGQPIAGGWKIRGDLEGDGGFDLTRSPERRPPGGFLLENLRPGTWRLRVLVQGNMPDEGRFTLEPEEKVLLAEGKVREVLFRYSGPPLRSQITIDIKSGKQRLYPAADKVLLMGPSVGVQAAGEEGSTSSGHTWSDLQWGLYTLEVRDPRFLPWRADRVRPSLNPVKAKLKGNSGILLTVVEAMDTRRPVPRYSVKMRTVEKESEGEGEEERFRRMFGGASVNLSNTRVRPGGKAAIDGLVAGDYVLVIDAPDFTRAEEPLPALQPGETREVMVRMFRGGVVAGEVIDSDGKTPLPGVAVELRPYEPGSDGEGLGAFTMGRMRSLRRDSRHGRMETDDRGRFRFENLLPGTYVVEASYSIKAENTLGLISFFTQRGAGINVLKEGVHIEDGQAFDDLRLVLPPGAYFKGRVIVPPGASCDELNLRLSSLEKQGRSAAMSVMTKVDSDGRFEVGPLRAGPADVVVILFSDESLESFGGRGMANHSLGQIVLTPGEPREHEFDLRDIWPGELKVTVLRNGKPLAGASVEVGERSGDDFFGGRIRGRTGKDGVAAVDRIFAGSHRLRVRDGDWSHRHPVPVVIQPGEETALTVEVTVVEGRLRVVKADGSALDSPVGVTIRRDGGETSQSYERTDDKGYLELELIPGRYELRSGSGRDRFMPGRPMGLPQVSAGNEAPGVFFEWTAQGPLPAQVALPEPEPKANEEGGGEEPPTEAPARPRRPRRGR